MTSKLSYEIGQVVDRATIRQIYSTQIALSLPEAQAILDVHQSGAVRKLTEIAGTWMNTTYELVNDADEAFVIKIQHRQGIGSLEAEHTIIRTLHQTGALPVSSICLHDASCTVIPYPYLLMNKLEGQSARTVFEQADQETRLSLATMLGKTIGLFHTEPIVTFDTLQRLDLNEWQGIIEEALTSDKALQQAITGISASFFEQLAAAMANVSTPPVEDSPVLLWCDPVFHNMLVSSCSSRYRLSGIFDFQQAGYGHPITDLMYVEGDFGRRRPPGVYEHPDYLCRFYDGYRAITGNAVQVPDELRQMNVMIRFALGVRFDWNCMRCFTPATPTMLQEMLTGLNQLSEE